jgi:Anti-sigma-28 factor, FlgM
MKIDGSNPEAIRPEHVRPVTGSHPVVTGKVQPVGPARPTPTRSDSVQISDAGRALAEGAAAARRATGSLSPERAADIRQRIRAGLYDSPQVAERVARRMLDRGDI